MGGSSNQDDFRSDNIRLFIEPRPPVRKSHCRGRENDSSHRGNRASAIVQKAVSVLNLAIGGVVQKLTAANSIRWAATCNESHLHSEIRRIVSDLRQPINEIPIEHLGYRTG